MLRRVSIAVAVLLSVVAGVASASLVSLGSAAEPLAEGRWELEPGDVKAGAPVADPAGGPGWAVRIFDANTSSRCIVASRTDGTSFGPVDAEGRVHDTGPVASGSCADPTAEPLQLGVLRVADSGGAGPRTVLFGLADDSVERVEVLTEGGRKRVALDAARTFVVVSEGMSRNATSTVAVTLSDGTSRTYEI